MSHSTSNNIGEMPLWVAVLTFRLLPLVLANCASAAFLTLRPHPLVRANAATSTLFVFGSSSLVLANCGSTAVFEVRPHPLVWANAATSTLFTLGSSSLVLENCASVGVFALWPLPLVLALGFFRALCAGLVYSFFVDVKLVLTSGIFYIDYRLFFIGLCIEINEERGAQIFPEGQGN